MPDKEPTLSNDEIRGLYSLTVHPEWPRMRRYLEVEQWRLSNQIDTDRDPAVRNELVGKRLMAKKLAKLGEICQGEANSRNFSLDEPG